MGFLWLFQRRTLIGVVGRKLENDFALAECMGVVPENCVITGRCGLQRILKEALNAFFQTLDRLYACRPDLWIAWAGTGHRDRHDI